MRKLVVLTTIALGLLLVAPALASAHTFYVHPSGGNDTAHIQKAFDAAVKAGPGSTVRLSAGHFTINDILVTGFQGTFRGAGSKTVIDCPSGGVGLDTLNNAPFTYLLCFKDSAVTVADMNFDITPSAPAPEWGNTTLYSGYPYDFLGAVICTIGDTSTAFDRVSSTGGPGDVNEGYDGLNTDESVIALPDATNGGGLCSMCSCTCTTGEGFWANGLSGASITIGGGQGNVFDSIGVSVALFDTGNSKVTVADNRFQDGNSFGGTASGPNQYTAGVTVLQQPGDSPSHYLVCHNSFRVGPPADAVDLWDYAFGPGVSPTLDAVIANNSVALEGSLSIIPMLNVAGIGEYDAQNVVVLANRFYGTGDFAMDAGVPLLGDTAPGSVNGWKIIANDVRGVICLPQSAGGAGAPIWLGPGTAHCLVIGGPAPTYVFNQGTDNTLINATPVGDPPAAASRLAAPSKMASLRAMKHL